MKPEPDFAARATRARQPPLAAGIVPVRRSASGWTFLLLRAYRYWDFPKGELAPAEAPLQTAIRELAEETGLTDPRLRWGERYYQTAPYAGGKVARYYLAEVGDAPVTLPVNPELGRPEHHEYRWFDAAEAAALLVPRVRSALEWAQGVLAEENT